MEGIGPLSLISYKDLSASVNTTSHATRTDKPISDTLLNLLWMVNEISSHIAAIA